MSTVIRKKICAYVLHVYSRNVHRVYSIMIKELFDPSISASSTPPSISPSSNLGSNAMAPKHAITNTDTLTWSAGSPNTSTVASTPLVSVAYPGITPKRNNVMTPDSAPESILFVDTEFALERVEWLLSEFRNARSAKDVASGIMIDEMLPETKVVDYGLEIFQARDPKDPPLSYSFEGSKFYIRACYKVYYDLIIACLESGRVDFVTLVGTPGTGKSLLYLYVFRRYRLDYPNVTIVVATFDKRSKMIQCWEYKPGKDPELHSKIPRIDGAVHFYDGPPSTLPRYQQMVCFSCPNYKWIDLHRKESRHKCLWFPPWTLEELVDANDVCELGLGEETITDRYNFFGGSARYCLSSDDEFVEKGRNQIKKKSLSIDSRDKLSVCLGGDDVLSHQLFHLLPEISHFFPFVSLDPQVFACSKIVDDLICTRIREKQKAQHHELVEMIRDIPEAFSFRGILFKRSTHFHLGIGGAFELRSLDSSRNFIQEIPAGRYSKMKTGCESIDGVVVLDDRVLLFQTTVASTHSVNAHGICEVLKSCLLYTSPSPRDRQKSRMPSSA